MNYTSKVIENFIDKMEFGDVILVRRPMVSPLGYSIQMLTGDTYSHSAMYLGDSTIYETTMAGAKLDNVKKFIECKVTVLRKKGGLDLYDKVTISNRVNSTIGAKYDYRAIAYMSWILLVVTIGLGKFRRMRKIADPIDDPERFYCHQLLAYLYDSIADIKVHYTNAVARDFLNSDDFEVILSDYPS